MVVFVVDTAVDELDGNYAAGDLSFREAINISSTGDTIQFAAGLSGQMLVLAARELALTKDIIIDGDSNGDNKADVTISGNNARRIFLVSGVGTDVDLNSLTMINGYTGNGGTIRATASTTLNINDSTISKGVADRGGAILTDSSTLALTNSLSTNNTSQIFGGALMVNFGSAILTHTTVFNNTTQGPGGGIAIYLAGTANVSNSAATARTEDLSSSVTLEADNSFFGTNVTITTDNGGNQNNADDPLLGELLSNGGTVLTLSPLDDILRGSAIARATIEGGGANDTIVGRAGIDTMIGGDGDDSYFVQQNGDTDGDGNSDFKIRLEGLHVLDAGNFLLRGKKEEFFDCE